MSRAGAWPRRAKLGRGTARRPLGCHCAPWRGTPLTALWSPHPRHWGLRGSGVLSLSESFTPDHKPLMGEAPELRGFFLGCGFNSAGELGATARPSGSQSSGWGGP